MFWILNKKDNTPGIAGSVPAIIKITGVKESTLNENFSRKKEKEFNTDDWRICKVELIKSKRK